MDKINKFDFDISWSSKLNEPESKIVDFFEVKCDGEKLKKEDEFISFSASLIQCFKEKIKASGKRIRVDSVIKAYKNAQESFNPSGDITLSEWCMACVNNFLNLSERKSFNLEPNEFQVANAKEDLKKYGLDKSFENVSQLYLETREESIQHAISANCRYF